NLYRYPQTQETCIRHTTVAPCRMADQNHAGLAYEQTIRMKTRFWDHYFYFFMSLLIVVVVAFGFSQTIDMNLIHPAIPPPFLLYVHAAVFTGWLAFFILQSALVRTSNVQIHRALGTFGIAMGIGIPVLGVATSLTMTRFDIDKLHNPDAATDMI